MLWFYHDKVLARVQQTFFLFELSAKLGRLPKIKLKIVSPLGYQTPTFNMTGRGTYYHRGLYVDYAKKIHKRPH